MADVQAIALTDDEIVDRVRNGEIDLYEVIMRRYNQTLFRIARSIVRDDIEAEDVIQDAYVNAFAHLDQFAGHAKFSTWLTRIAVNEALSRLRRRRRFEALEESGDATQHRAFQTQSHTPGPEEEALNEQTIRLLEAAIDGLPEAYRSVFVMRAIDGMSTSETAACLNLTGENVKIRMHRARLMLRDLLSQRFGAAAPAAFRFMGYRCNRVVNAVLYRLTHPAQSGPSAT